MASNIYQTNKKKLFSLINRRRSAPMIVEMNKQEIYIVANREQREKHSIKFNRKHNGDSASNNGDGDDSRKQKCESKFILLYNRFTDTHTAVNACEDFCGQSKICAIDGNGHGVD